MKCTNLVYLWFTETQRAILFFLATGLHVSMLMFAPQSPSTVSVTTLFTLRSVSSGIFKLGKVSW